MTTTERTRQEIQAEQLGDGISVIEYHYRLVNGSVFKAIAHTEAGAFRVLNAEHPGMLAVFIGAYQQLLGPSLAADSPRT